METPTTKLEAINEMLAVIGESPLNTLNEPGMVDSHLAIALLDGVSRALQMKGWHFNTRKDVELSIDGGGLINLPANLLDIRPASTSTGANRNFTPRNGKLYDLDNGTNVFTKAVKLTLISYLPFEDLSEPARYFITIRAARRFQDRMLGSNDVARFIQRDELEAQAAFRQSDEGQQLASNFVTGNLRTARVLMGRNRTWPS